MKLKFARYHDNAGIIKELQQIKDSVEDTGLVVIFVFIITFMEKVVCFCVCLTLEHLTCETRFSEVGLVRICLPSCIAKEKFSPNKIQYL